MADRPQRGGQSPAEKNSYEEFRYSSAAGGTNKKGKVIIKNFQSVFYFKKIKVGGSCEKCLIF